MSQRDILNNQTFKEYINSYKVLGEYDEKSHRLECIFIEDLIFLIGKIGDEFLYFLLDLTYGGDLIVDSKFFQSNKDLFDEKNGAQSTKFKLVTKNKKIIEFESENLYIKSTKQITKIIPPDQRLDKKKFACVLGLKFFSKFILDMDYFSKCVNIHCHKSEYEIKEHFINVACIDMFIDNDKMKIRAQIGNNPVGFWRIDNLYKRSQLYYTLKTIGAKLPCYQTIVNGSKAVVGQSTVNLNLGGKISGNVNVEVPINIKEVSDIQGCVSLDVLSKFHFCIDFLNNKMIIMI